MTAAEAINAAQATDGHTEDAAQTSEPETKKHKNYHRKKSANGRVVAINNTVAKTLAAREAAQHEQPFVVPPLVDMATQPKQLPASTGKAARQDKLVIVDGGQVFIGDKKHLTDAAYTVTMTDHPVKAHPYDIYRLIGEMVVRDFDDLNITKRVEKKSLWNTIFPKPEAPDMLEAFAYTMNRDAKPISLKSVNPQALPLMYAHEGVVAAQFMDQPDFDCAQLLMQVQKFHYQSHVKDDNKKPLRKFDFRGNDHMITGYATSNMMQDIKDNGVEIGIVEANSRRPKFVERLLTPEVAAMNQRDVFFIMAGYEFEKRVHARVDAKQHQRLVNQ